MPPRKRERAKAAITESHFIYGETSRVIKLPGNIRDWQVKCVCGGSRSTCNNGWMKAIEDKAKPILTPLIKGDDVIIYPNNQQLIATWATLKVMVAEYDQKSPVTIANSHRKYLYKHKTPPIRGWAIWIGHFEKTRWAAEWLSRPVPMYFGPPRLDLVHKKASRFNAAANTQVIGKMFIHVIHTPMPFNIHRWRFAPPYRGTLFRIWPPAQTHIRWPARALDDADADRISEAFFRFCGTQVERAAANLSAAARGP